MDGLDSALNSLIEARARAVDWLLKSIDPDGRPHGSELGNGWTRMPWTFMLTGETAAAMAVLEWARREALDERGSFREGPALETGGYAADYVAYKLGQLAMGALHLERYDVANLLLDRLEDMQLPNGGFPIEPRGAEFAEFTEMTSTAQAGVAALLGGRMEMAKRCRDWVMKCVTAQPDLPHRFYAGRLGEQLVTEPPARLSWLLEVDYRKPRQAYYQTGVAAVVLGLYAMRMGDAEALAAAHRCLEVNIAGTEEQYTDLGSVQLCKFGWGLGVMEAADPSRSYAPHLIRMADWFVKRQASDGSWGPSSFLTSPTMVDLVMKTAEHAMEVTWLISGLTVAKARSGN